MKRTTTILLSLLAACLVRTASAAALPTEITVQLVMTYENASGEVTEFKFYQYYAASTGHISGGKIFVVVNGVGEFYTTNDLVDKVVNDTSRVLDGLDVDAYGQN